MNVKTKRARILLIVIIALVIILAAVVGFTANSYLARSAYPLAHEDIIKKYAGEYDLDAYMVAGIIHTESRFKADAKSRVGAIGLMQIMPDTGEWIAGKLSVSDFSASALNQPDMNIRFGCWYLRFLLDRFEPEAAIAAYNAGHGSVDKWLKNPQYSANGKDLDEIPYPETRRYVPRVLDAMKNYEKLYEKELE